MGQCLCRRGRLRPHLHILLPPHFTNVDPERDSTILVLPTPCTDLPDASAGHPLVAPSEHIESIAVPQPCIRAQPIQAASSSLVMRAACAAIGAVCGLKALIGTAGLSDDAKPKLSLPPSLCTSESLPSRVGSLDEPSSSGHATDGSSDDEMERESPGPKRRCSQDNARSSAGSDAGWAAT